MGNDWPTMKARKMQKIIERVCGRPVRQSGSHAIYRTPDGRTVLFAMHAVEVDSGLVRDILVDQLEFTETQARRVARRGKL